MEKAYIIEEKGRYSLWKAWRMNLKVEQARNFSIITIPVLKKKRDYTRACYKIKKKGIKKVCYPYFKDKILEYYIKQEFKIYQGESILSEIFPEVLSFIAKKKNIGLSDCHLVFIGNRPDITEKYINKICRIVRRISLLTTKPYLFSNIIKKYQEDYGIFIDIKGKDDKVKKYRYIYVNLDHKKVFREDLFRNANLLDIYKIYKGSFQQIVLEFMTESEAMIDKYQIIKNISFAEFIRENNQNISENDYKIVNIEKL